MNERNLVICDKELRYANGLGDNLSARKEFALRIHICTCLTSVLQFQEVRKIHILIIDETFPYEDRKQMEAEQTFVLTAETCSDLGEKEREVYKYRSADRIFAEIFETYCEQTNNNILKIIKKQQKNLLAVYSPIHRVGKTTFALTLGKEIAKKRKTLYLNLEEFADVGERFVRAEGRNLGDLFYYMHQEETNLSLRLSTMSVQMEHLNYIPPFLNSDDLKEISGEEWQRLFQHILENSIYETLILDLSDSIQGLWQILQCCDMIYMPILEDGISKQKIKLFEKEWKRRQMNPLDEKIHQFRTDDVVVYARELAQEEKIR